MNSLRPRSGTNPGPDGLKSDALLTAAPSIGRHIPWLDGLRGIAALWVLVSHVLILTGMRPISVLSWGYLPVDLFMMLSGFLMAHHYMQRQAIEPWEKVSTATRFWGRRFFRIAPLYYVLLAVGLLFGPALGAYRTSISDIWPEATTLVDRYNDQSFANIAQHVSFLFGAFPTYAFRTPLPDWSIGLEMQFYLVFPLLMLAIARGSGILVGLSIVAACYTTRWLAHDFFALFLMPSFLPMKIGVFIIGMWAAIGRGRSSMLPKLASSIGVALVASAWERHTFWQATAFLLIIVSFYYLMNDGTLPLLKEDSKIIKHARALLQGKIFSFAGDTSYGVYLLHLIIVIPVAGTLAKSASYVGMPAGARLLICLALSAIPVYFGAWMLHMLIEKPGIRVGKAFVASARVFGGAKRIVEH